ncbi:hypothetical protein [Pseudonocardia asaccharolytica]|uniref:Uncharacterized protein n=1 Tax=Pseudonocardia asaccharolytica DSM 44247 = NBRC 16224 TaxID=1123024 RepID=A0A511CZ07_9PSEU|nr:hypothetical protein [Pseudonocardia asaccharolytica]GEL17707.1 hypothetical protein PA7_15440 [Pseudonocardia asaccharolytica DSM 44247 = NBRC 16224]
MTPGEVLAAFGGWASLAVPVALIWGRGRCRHPHRGPVGTGLAVRDHDRQAAPVAPGGPVVVVVRHEHVVTVRHVHAAGSLPVGAVRPPVVVDGEVLPPVGRGWVR